MPTTTIEVQELPTRLAEAVSLAAVGTEVIVTEGNIPRARLVPLSANPARVAGLHPGAILTTDDFDVPLPESFWGGGAMKGLLDTHTFIWWDSDPSKLSANVLAFLQNPSNTLLLSVGSVWEMVIKLQLGKLTLKAPLTYILTQQQANGIQILPVVLSHVLAVENLPPAHKDPFDRLLAAQANVEGALLLSADPIFAKYPVQVLW